MSFKATPLEPFGVLIEPLTMVPLTRVPLTKEPQVELASVKALDVEKLRELFVQKHLLVLRGFNTFTGADDFASFCEAWGEISLWPFGKVLELIEQEKPEDHIFDCSYVPLHWDGMYRPQVPEYQIFHCVQAPLPGQGGRTTFSNTAMALENSTAETKQLWSSMTATYKRKMEFYDSRTVSPLVTKHPFRDFSVIRYNEAHLAENGPLVNQVEQEWRGLDSKMLDAFHRDLRVSLYAPGNFYAHSWQNGDVVIADNFTLLHGREAFTSKSPRHIQRVQVLSNPPLPNPGLESYK